MDENKNIEKLFHSNMDQHEVPYQEGAWERMEELLDEEEKRPLWIIWFSNKNNQLKTLLIMTLAGMITAWSMLSFFGMNEVSVKSNEQEILGIEKNHSTLEFEELGLLEPKEDIAEFTIPQEGVDEKSDDLQFTQSSDNTSNKTGNTSNSNGSENSNSQLEEHGIQGASIVQTIDSLKNVLIAKVDTTEILTRVVKMKRQEWVPEHYEYEYYYNDQLPIKDFWFGVHYATQNQFNTSNDWRSGFNLQFMSGDISKKKENAWAVYAGLDWGMMFYGRSSNTNVVINTVNEDSGYTRLRNNSTEFFYRMHFEYAKHRVVPYFNFNIGPRLYYTNQKVASYLNLTENESQTRHNADLNVSMMAGIGVGTRVKVAPRVSLDLRYELMYGTRTNQVDLENSSFNGLSYNLVRRSFNPNQQMVKFGVIIDFSEERREKKLVEGYYRTVTYDSLVVENTTDSTVIVIPCDCNKKRSSVSTNSANADENNNKNCDEEEEENPSIIDTIIRSSGSGSSGGSSGGGKGSFPGIKSKPPVLK